MSDFDSWQQSLRRPIPALDGIRGLAIVSVLAHQLIIDREEPSRWLRRLLAVPQAGWFGVQLFFVLSGFLITGILLETRRAENRWLSFFMRRTLRIFPPYYFLLSFLFWVLPAVVNLPSDVAAELKHQPWYWFYLANWTVISGAGISVLAHCWSLSVEEQFYLLWPPLVFSVRPRTLAWVCVVAAIAAFAIRLWLVLTGKNPEYSYSLTFCRMDALSVGALTALLVRSRSMLARLGAFLRLGTWPIAMAVLVTAMASGLLARTNPVTLTVGYVVLAVASAWLILLAVRDNAEGSGPVGALLSFTPLRLFGKHSYAIYLFHHPLDIALKRLFLERALSGASRPLFLAVQASYIVAGSCLLLGIAVVFNRGFEQPILNLKRHFTAREGAVGNRHA
jgi:peptidoglycan/LPS O-acetylase OafA/YrhL